MGIIIQKYLMIPPYLSQVLRANIKAKLISSSIQSFIKLATNANLSKFMKSIRELFQKTCWSVKTQFNCINSTIMNQFLMNGFTCMQSANQVLTSRQTTFITHKANKNKVGLNALLANILYILNGKISFDCLNISINSFKTKCKIEILKLWSSASYPKILQTYYYIQKSLTPYWS